MASRGRIGLVALCFATLTAPAAAQDSTSPTRFVTAFRGTLREYFIYLPAKFDPSTEYSLVVMVHGSGSAGGRFTFSPRAAAAASEIGFRAIVISPSFRNDDDNPSRFPALGEGDFLEHLLSEARQKYKLKPKIFLAGYSRGGQFVHRFAFSHPELVQAVAAFSSGTWTTPDGHLLVETVGEIRNPEKFLANPANAVSYFNSRLDLFTPDVAREAGRRAAEGARAIPFLVMCGTLDPRLAIARKFAESLKTLGYDVTTEWPRNPHGCIDQKCLAQFADTFARYPKAAISFFAKVSNAGVNTRSNP